MLDWWSVKIINTIDSRTVNCFPYNTGPTETPPYPGFHVLEDWLKFKFPDAVTERLYNDGSAVLNVSFASPEDLLIFLLVKP
jgi:hypothetical protein